MHIFNVTLILSLLVAAVGCGSSPNAVLPPKVESANATAQQVCVIAAELFRVKVSDVKPTTSLADLNADQLDLVELVMELEDQFDISIPDKAITAATGGDDWQSHFDRLTIDKLTQIVTSLQ